MPPCARRARRAPKVRAALARLLGASIALVLAMQVGAQSTAAADEQTPPAALAQSGIIAGLVTGSDGAPAVGVKVRLDPRGTGSARYTLTDRGGAYRFDGVPPGQYSPYFMCESACEGNYRREFWGDTPDLSSRVWIDLAHERRVDLATTLDVRGEISGTVRADDGAPIAGAQVTIIKPEGLEEGQKTAATTDAEGRYRLRNLPDGSYKLLFEAEYGETHFSEYWDDTTIPHDAEPVIIRAAEVVEGIDPILIRTALISGTVVNEDGARISHAEVRLWEIRDDGLWWVCCISSTANLADFQYKRLRPGTYVLQTFIAGTGWGGLYGRSEWWEDQPDASSAKQIVLEPGDRFDADVVLEGGPASLSVFSFQGTQRVGDTISARATSATPGAVLTYQWFNRQTPIAGATAPRYTLTPAELNAQMAVEVTAVAPGRALARQRVDSYSSVQPQPLEVGEASILGVGWVGSTLTAVPGEWTPGTSLEYQWRADGVDLVGATDSTLVLTAAEVRKNITVRVIGSKHGYETRQSTSRAISISFGHVDLSGPVIEGVPEVGATLTAIASAVAPGAELTYEWWIEGVNEVHTERTLVLTDQHVGRTITVLVHASAPDFLMEWRHSAPTAPVRYPPWGAVSRIAGADRFETAALISTSAFDPGVPVAYLASGADFPDALAGAPVAGSNGGPVLLSTADTLPDSIVLELERLQPERIVILGGTASIGAAVESRLNEMRPGAVSRIAGADRFETSSMISASQFKPGAPVAFIASGANFPDALAGAPVAGIGGGPVLLTGVDQLPGSVVAELERLHPERIVILGDTPSVSSAVEAQLEALRPGAVSRIAGDDRFHTAALISESTFTAGQVPVVYLASGTSFPDALAGAPVAGIVGGPVLLATTEILSDAVISELERLRPDRVVVLGGPPSIGSSVESQLSALG